MNFNQITKVNNIKTFTFQGQEVNVKQYISTADKDDLITLTLQSARMNNIYHSMLFESYLNIYMIFMYSDVEFSAEDKANALMTYDTLLVTGFVDMFLENMNSSELERIRDCASSDLYHSNAFNMGINGALSNFIDNIGTNAEIAQNVLKDIDLAQFKEVIDFAKVVNNGNVPGIEQTV